MGLYWFGILVTLRVLHSAEKSSKLAPTVDTSSRAGQAVGLSVEQVL